MRFVAHHDRLYRGGSDAVDEGGVESKGILLILLAYSANIYKIHIFREAAHISYIRIYIYTFNAHARRVVKARIYSVQILSNRLINVIFDILTCAADYRETSSNIRI